MKIRTIPYLLVLLILIPSCNRNNVVLTGFDVKKTPHQGQAEGYHYFLPRTVIAVDVTVTRAYHQPGPFARFAEHFLGLEHVITSPGIDYVISGISLNSYAEPDPDQLYFAAFDPKDQSNFITLSEAGLLLSVNKTVEETEAHRLPDESKQYGFFGTEATFNYFIDLNLQERIDTILERVRVDTMTVERQTLRRSWVEKSSEVRAREVADYILKIREKKFDLITGFAEIPYSREALTYMYEEMSRKENDYLSLFTGISSSSSIQYRYTFIPDPAGAQSQQVLFYFSGRDGVSEENRPGSVPVSIQARKDQGQNPLAALAQRRPAARSGQTGFHYRIPEHSTVIIREGNTPRAEARMLVNQYGVVTWLPPHEMEIEFYPNTGSIKSVGRLRNP